MRTLIVKIEDGAESKNIVAAMRQLKGVAEVKIQKEKKLTPPCQFTAEELNAEIDRSLEAIREGRTISHAELKKEMRSWK